jgi:hypothetical protein
MKFYFVIIFCAPFLLFSQPRTDLKADYDWILGYWDYSPTNPNTWRFKPIKDTFRINYISRKENVFIELLNSAAQLSDIDGNLLLYSDGCSIANGKYQTIIGGDTINKNLYSVCPGGLGWQNTLFLRGSIDTNSILFFQLSFGYSSKVGVYPQNLLCTKIKKDSNLIKVVAEDSIVYRSTDQDTMSGQIVAVRHANGRDWWIIAPFAQKAGYYKVLVKANAMETSKQYIGQNDIYIDKSEEGGGQAVVSPDGSKYARYNRRSDVQIMDFDRCNGIFSNYIHIPITDIADTANYSGGCAISSNSRFLYVFSYYYIYQYDLFSSNVAASKIIVAVYDGILNQEGFELNFNTGQLAADGRIYILPSGYKNVLHTIEYPDSLGIACKVIQRKHMYPTYIGNRPPNFPNFRLGALKGSPCDTLTTPTQEINQIGQLKIYPNPATDILKIDMTLDDYSALERCQLRVVDIVGKVHQTHTLSNFASIKEISVANLANGLYFVQLVDKQGFLIANSKVVVAR